MPERTCGVPTDRAVLMARFWAKVEKTDTCWLWTGATSWGYGKFNVDGRLMMAHRFSYEHHVGPIPAGLDLDHVKARGCTHRNCVNPAHLEPVTRRENLLRGVSANAVKTHCPQGHEYTEANTYRFPDGRRQCRACQSDRSRAYWRRRRESRADV